MKDIGIWGHHKILIFAGKHHQITLKKRMITPLNSLMKFHHKIFKCLCDSSLLSVQRLLFRLCLKIPAQKKTSKLLCAEIFERHWTSSLPPARLVRPPRWTLNPPSKKLPFFFRSSQFCCFVPREKSDDSSDRVSFVKSESFADSVDFAILIQIFGKGLAIVDRQRDKLRVVFIWPCVGWLPTRGIL